MSDPIDERNVTLRIKRIYFDRILDGEKTIEYREKKPFYDRIFATKPATLTLHYQKSRRLTVEVKRVKVVKKPDHITACTTPEVYAIYLGRVLDHRD